MKRIRAFFSGMVQGVGFRWTTRSIAANHKVSGYVKNLMDGRVEVLVEGEDSEASAFLNDIQSRLGGYIRGVETHEEQPAGAGTGFDIRF